MKHHWWEKTASLTIYRLQRKGRYQRDVTSCQGRLDTSVNKLMRKTSTGIFSFIEIIARHQVRSSKSHNIIISHNIACLKCKVYEIPNQSFPMLGQRQLTLFQNSSIPTIFRLQNEVKKITAKHHTCGMTLLSQINIH